MVVNVSIIWINKKKSSEFKSRSINFNKSRDSFEGRDILTQEVAVRVPTRSSVELHGGQLIPNRLGNQTQVTVSNTIMGALPPRIRWRCI